MSSLLPDCRRLVTIDEGGLDQLEHDGADIGDEAIDERLAALDIDALATIVYTSGTTGRPKGCMLTHRNLRTNVVQSLDAIGSALRPDDSALLFLPLAHTLTKTTALFVMEAGCQEAFATDIQHLPEEFALTQPTVICAVPRIFEKVFNSARHHAHAEHKGWIFDRAVTSPSAGRTNEQPVGVMPWTGAGHTVFDRLVYGKVRVALGGNLRLAFSGGAPLGERLTHFFAGIGARCVRGVRPHRDRTHAHRQSAGRVEAGHGRSTGGRHVHPHRCRWRDPRQGTADVPGLLAQPRTRPPRC